MNILIVCLFNLRSFVKIKGSAENRQDVQFRKRISPLKTCHFLSGTGSGWRRCPERFRVDPKLRFLCVWGGATRASHTDFLREHQRRRLHKKSIFRRAVNGKLMPGLEKRDWRSQVKPDYHENSFGLKSFRFMSVTPPSLVCVNTNSPDFSAYLPTSSLTTSAPIPASILLS